MVKVLIVEDEYLVRVGLRSSIDWVANGFELLEDAVDGHTALDMILNQLPDIVLLDIQIPKMDGIEVLKQMQAAGAVAKVVVISCLDDFEPVKEAMRYGAVDYLRKFTLKPDELLGLLGAIRDDLTKDTPLAQNVPPEEDLQKELEADYISIVAGSDLPLPQSGMADGRTMFLDVDHPGKHFYAINGAAFLNMVRQTMKSYMADNFVFQTGSFTYAVLFNCTHAAVPLAKKLQEQIARTMGVTVSVGVGPHWQDAQGLKRSVEAAKSVSRDKFYQGGAWLWEYPAADRVRHSCPCMEKSRQRLARLLEIGDSAGALCQLEDFFEDVRAEGNLSPDSVKILSIELLAMAAESTRQPYAEMKSVDFRTVMELQMLTELQQYVLARSAALLSAQGEGKGGAGSQIIRNALQYIGDNLSQNITLAQLAKAVSVSEPYLSMLFKRQVGENCIAYINRKKIELAKPMLLRGMLVYEAAAQLGYDNSNYFGKVFKKYVGMAPEQYRLAAKDEKSALEEGLPPAPKEG